MCDVVGIGLLCLFLGSLLVLFCLPGLVVGLLLNTCGLDLNIWSFAILFGLSLTFIRLALRR